MDDRFQDILDSLPEIPERSSLGPYRELIDELRGRGRTYRNIAHILAEKCQLQVSPSTIYRFVSRRSAGRTRSPARRRTDPVSAVVRATTGPVTESVAQSNEPKKQMPLDDEILQRIAALKLKPAPARPDTGLFRYDPSEPLHLRPKDEGKN